MTPRASRFEKRLFLLVLILALALAACGSENPTGPGAPRPAAVDLTPLVEFLNDPIVRLLPTILKNQAAAAPLQTSLTTLSRSAVEGNVPAVRQSFQSSRGEVASYRKRLDAGVGDPVILSAIELVLLQAEALLDVILLSTGAARIELL
jgi:hypothetical protein